MTKTVIQPGTQPGDGSRTDKGKRERGKGTAKIQSKRATLFHESEGCTMAKTATVLLNQDSDEKVIQELAACLRANGEYARQLRDLADVLESEQRVQGLTWQPRAGQILICRFGLGFREPEMVKTRPVMVISPKVTPWTHCSPDKQPKAKSDSGASLSSAQRPRAGIKI